MDKEKMLNLLHMEMISYEKMEPMRIQHFCKVYGYVSLIGRMEGLDEETQFILDTAALTHDIGIKPAIEKYHSAAGPYQEELGPDVADPMLRNLGFPEDVISRVKYLIGHHHTYTEIDGMDYQILVEADFLVNLLEGKSDETQIRNVLKNIFKTETGKKILTEMFLPD